MVELGVVGLGGMVLSNIITLDYIDTSTRRTSGAMGIFAPR